MPLLDVSDALDVLNMDRFSVVSSAMAVGATGQAATTLAAPVTAYGVVTPEKSSLERMADGTRLAACIDVYTLYPLTAGIKTDDATSRPADLVLWHGRTWVVAMVEDFSGFGAGYLHAVCDLVQQMPTAQEPQQVP